MATDADALRLSDSGLGKISCFQSVTLVQGVKLCDRAPCSKGARWRHNGHSLARGSQVWVIQKANGWMFHAMDDEGLDLGWFSDEMNCVVEPRVFTDMPSEVRSAVIQLYLDHDGQPNWEALLASRSWAEIQDMNYSEMRNLFTEHAMQPRMFQSRDSYLKEVEIMVAGGIGGKIIQLLCARSEEGVSVTLMALSGRELGRLTLSSSEETVGALREAVGAALGDLVKFPRVVLHDGRMLADIGHVETLQTAFDI